MAIISVVTLNKGRAAHLERLLQGLSRGSHPHECVVVQMGRDRLARSPWPFGLREIDVAGDGLPLAAARNAGRSAARGDVLVFLDVDCIPSSDLVETMASVLAEHDALVCCSVTYLPGGPIPDDWTEHDLERRGTAHPARPFPAEGLTRAAQPGLFWSLAFAVRAVTFDRIGGFDEGFVGYGAEDTDFAYRADSLGVPILLSGRGRAFHQRHEAHDPPLQHFDDILRNARVFEGRHHFWPMRGWLDAFVELGLIARDDAAGFRVLRRPTAEEIAASAIPRDRAF